MVIMIKLMSTMRMMLMAVMRITTTTMNNITPLVLTITTVFSHAQVLLSWVQFVIPTEVAVLMRIMDSVLRSPLLMSLAMCEYYFCEMFHFVNVCILSPFNINAT